MFLQEELSRVKALLEQSERHLRDEEERHMTAGKEIVKLTELKNALQQQADTGGIAATTDKQVFDQCLHALLFVPNYSLCRFL